ncbi:MAG: hypothetical protein OQL06_09590 [Gammaproteobacteria bacterium]|nr:hypothetical protein [Gammaproteobacteria bacterium]
MKKIIALMLVLGFISVTGCSGTLEGMGKDIEKMGKSIQGQDSSE